MHYEFAVEPELFDDVKMWQFFFQHFGLEHGRFVSEFPKHWPVLVLKCCKAAGQRDLDIKRVEVLLEQLKSRGGLIGLSRNSYDSNLSWLKNALTENQRKAFRAIISNGTTDVADNVLHTDKLLDDEPGWTISRQDKISRTPEAMVSCCDVLLSQSRQILFADPHFYPDLRRFVNTLSHFLETLEARKEYLSRIEYHLKCHREGNPYPQNWFSLFQDGCENRLPRQIPSNMKVTFFVWDDNGCSEQFHARYVMTELGGIAFDSGLDSRDRDTTDVTLMTQNLHQQSWKAFQEKTAAYKLVDKVCVVGTKMKRTTDRS